MRMYNEMDSSRAPHLLITPILHILEIHLTAIKYKCDHNERFSYELQ